MRRRIVSLGIAALLVAIAAPAALAATSRRAAARSHCHLAGFVRTSPGPCPRGLATGAAPRAQWDPIGWLVGSGIGAAIHKALSVVVSWVSDGAGAALRFTASLIGTSTQPALQSTWFSQTYWRVGALSVMLAVPFLFAAAIHAVVRSDLALLARAAFGYLPLAMLGVGIAAPLTSLVLSATDEMCAFVARAGAHADTAFLTHAAIAITTSSLVQQDPFITFFAAVLTVAATLALWLELIMRDAAVDVVVLMLPLFFAAMVWPARRIWAIRAIEGLLALILAKFAIVAVLTLGGAALDNATSGLGALLTGATLVLLATLSPWALLRLLPLHEVAAAAAGGLSHGPRSAFSQGLQMAASRGRSSGSSSPETDPRNLSSPDTGNETGQPPDVWTGTRPRSGRPGAGVIGGERDAPLGLVAGDAAGVGDPDGTDGRDGVGDANVAGSPDGGDIPHGVNGGDGPTAPDIAGAGGQDGSASPASAVGRGPAVGPVDPRAAEPVAGAALDVTGASDDGIETDAHVELGDDGTGLGNRPRGERPPLPEQFRPGVFETPIVFTDGRRERMTEGVWGLEEGASGSPATGTTEPGVAPPPMPEPPLPSPRPTGTERT